MSKLTVRLYNVRFGDGVLVSVPDRDDAGAPLMRHILIDVGNAASKEGGENEVFTPVFDDILSVLDGQPLDLYVATHEHMDHVQGLLWASKNRPAGEDLAAMLNVQHVWLPASAHPDYYDTHPNAKKQFDIATAAYSLTQKALMASSDPVPDLIETLLRNNNRFLPQSPLGALSHRRTADCVEYIRKLAPDSRTHYVYRSVGGPADGVPPFDPSVAHPFRDAELEIWAPEEDSSQYYGQFRPIALGSAPGVAPGQTAAAVTPPPGVDAGAFYNLVDLRQRGFVDNLLQIDKSANNSSIVFCLKWHGWKLLFPGDAELRSWKTMDAKGTLSPIHFLKISHHGSHNGTPDEDLLAKILPVPAPDSKPRQAAASTFPNTYNGIPHSETFDELANIHGCSVRTTEGLPDGAPLILEFDGPSEPLA